MWVKQKIKKSRRKYFLVSESYTDRLIVKNPELREIKHYFNEINIETAFSLF